MTQVAALLSKVHAERDRRSLHSFLRSYWPVVEPGKAFIDNWHIGAICEHLQAVTDGQIKRLLVNVPFRTAKPVHVDEPVLTDDGYKRLGDIQVGDRVLTHKGRFRSVLAVHEQGRLPTVVVRTFGGRAVRAAPDHPFMTTQGWVNAGELTDTHIAKLAMRDRFDQDIYSDRVLSVEAGEDGDCRCLSIEEDATFTVNNLIVHNSTITSVMWPAWSWIDDPSHQWLCGSYAEKLAIRDSLKMRRLITSPKYREAYGDIYDLEADQNQKVRFQNTKAGYRIAFGMTGGVMGDGGDTVLIDDPHDRQGAHSDAERETAITTYDEALITRLNQPAESAIVIIMQRLHHQDLSGHVLTEKGWCHLMIPMEFEPTRRCVTVLGWRDPRTQDGELMWPERFPAETVESLKIGLGDYGAAGQLQQRPSPAGGGILKVNHFQVWPAAKPLPDLLFVVQSYDTAFTEQTDGDPTACSVWGVFRNEIGGKVKNCALLLEFWTDHLGYPALRTRAMADWEAQYGGVKGDPLKPSRRADLVLIEKKGSGQSLLQDLRQANVPVVPYDPGRADKKARAHIAAPILELDLFYVMGSSRRGEADQPCTWARPFVSQCEQFPNGEHDDGVDTFTQAAIYLKDAGHLALPFVPDEEVKERDYAAERARKVNPYG